MEYAIGMRDFFMAKPKNANNGATLNKWDEKINNQAMILDETQRYSTLDKPTVQKRALHML